MRFGSDMGGGSPPSAVTTAHPTLSVPTRTSAYSCTNSSPSTLTWARDCPVVRLIHSPTQSGGSAKVTGMGGGVGARSTNGNGCGETLAMGRPLSSFVGNAVAISATVRWSSRRSARRAACHRASACTTQDRRPASRHHTSPESGTYNKHTVFCWERRCHFCNKKAFV